MPLNKAYKYTSQVMAENMMSIDAKEGISAFIEKRSPSWKNKQMNQKIVNDQLIKKSLTESKIIAMVGVSSVKKETGSNIIRRPSIIVMSYLQEFGYKVIPVNPFSVGKIINNEKVVERLEDITDPIDIVNVFRPSNETPQIANQAAKIGTKVLWLQYGIQNEEARKISELNNIAYISNKCIKQEYQRLFLKMSPVFPALKTD